MNLRKSKKPGIFSSLISDKNPILFIPVNLNISVKKMATVDFEYNQTEAEYAPGQIYVVLIRQVTPDNC